MPSDALGSVAKGMDAVERAIVALNAMMESWFDYHDAHGLTQPVTGKAGNAFDLALASREELEALAALRSTAPVHEKMEQIISAWALAHNINGAARNDLFKRLRSTAPTPEEAIGANGQQVHIISINGRRVEVDSEVAPIVAALNAAGLETIASCSGHGHRPGDIALRDGREIIIARDFDEARKINALFPIDINGNRAAPTPEDNSVCKICDGGPGNHCACNCGMKLYEAAPTPEDDTMPYEAGGGAYRSAEPRPGFTRRSAPTPADQGVAVHDVIAELRALVPFLEAHSFNPDVALIPAALISSLQARITALENGRDAFKRIARLIVEDVSSIKEPTRLSPRTVTRIVWDARALLNQGDGR